MKVLPYPDEVSHAYLARLNRIPSGMLRSTAHVSGWDFLAEHSEMPLPRFAAQHTFFYFNGSFQRSPKWEHNNLEMLSKSMDKTALRAGGDTAVSCPHCVAEDIQFWGHSYWRRSHHLPGVERCLKHNVLLDRHGPRHKSWERDPSVVAKAPSRPSVSERTLEQEATAKRYAFAASSLLDLGRRKECAVVSVFLSRRLAELSIKPSNVEAVCKLVMERLPRDGVFESIQRRMREYSAVTRKSVLPHTSGMQVQVALAMISALSASIEEVEAALSEEVQRSPNPWTRHTFESVGMDPAQLVCAIVESGFNISATARRLNLTITQAKALCRLAGLSFSEGQRLNLIAELKQATLSRGTPDVHPAVRVLSALVRRPTTQVRSLEARETHCIV